MALYYTGDNHFSGDYLVNGGYGYEQSGGSGTVYTAQITNGTVVHHRLHLDNIQLTNSRRIEEIEKVKLTGGEEAANSQTVVTPGNITFHIDKPIYRCYHCWWRSLVNLMSGSAVDKWLQVTSNTATLTITLPQTMYVRHLKVYPHCSAT